MTDELTSAPEGAGDAVVSDAPADKGSEPTIDRGAEVTPRQSVDRAFDLAFADDAPAEKAKAAPEDADKGGPDRDEHGRFKAKEEAPEGETKPDAAKPDAEKAETKPEDKGEPSEVQPPSRFVPEAKAEWAKVPPVVRSEIVRMQTELEAGIAKHREGAEKWGELSEFDALAKQHGTDIKTALRNYVAAEQELGKDLIGGLDKIAQGFGVSLRQVAEKVMGQKPDEARTQDEKTIRELRAEIDGLKKQVGGVTTTFEQQRRAEVQRTVETFAKDHPRFEELAADIEHMLKTGFASDLPDAYAKAELLKPAPKPATATDTTAAKADTTDRAEQIDKGRLSTAGAPRSGSNPANRKPASSAGESIDRAFDQLGL